MMLKIARKQSGLQVMELTTEQIKNRIRIIDSNTNVLNNEMKKLEKETKVHDRMLKENVEKIKLNKQLPFLVSNIVEVWRAMLTRNRVSLSRHCMLGVVVHQVIPLPEEGEEEEGSAVQETKTSTTAVVIKTSTRQVRLRCDYVCWDSTIVDVVFIVMMGVQTVFLPIPGLVSPDELKPNDLVGVNKDNFLILEKLPTV